MPKRKTCADCPLIGSFDQIKLARWRVFVHEWVQSIERLSRRNMGNDQRELLAPIKPIEVQRYD
jgi:hypothetical protein